MSPTTSENNPTLARVRQYLQGKIANLCNCPVHEYERRIDTEERLRDLASAYDDAGNRIIHCWMISVESDLAQSSRGGEGDADDVYERTYNVVLRGYRTMNDDAATEVTFQAEIETLHDALDTDPTLGGYADRTEPTEARSRNVLRTYANILVHSCEIVLPVVLRRDRIA